nr:MAG TPA: hypothetical protein [Caudoviricetes sp.]DAX26902.1 MAG TPA: hypothetical protein [Caudoviricetes sp.]
MSKNKLLPSFFCKRIEIIRLTQGNFCWSVKNGFSLTIITFRKRKNPCSNNICTIFK